MSYKTLEDIKRVISLGKDEEKVIKPFAKSYLIGLDYEEYQVALEAEYDELFPKYEDKTEIVDEVEVFTRVLVDYSEDENYMTLEEYKAETKVVQEEVEATYDEDGMELTPYIAEVIELVRPYVELEVTDAVLEAKLIEYGYDYKAKREAEYPDITNYIDGIVKGDNVQVQAYIDACLAVKAKYPKPIEELEAKQEAKEFIMENEG